jgi:hypothetical protein
MLFGGISWEVFIIQTTMDNFMNDSHVHGIKVAPRFFELLKKHQESWMYMHVRGHTVLFNDLFHVA